MAGAPGVAGGAVGDWLALGEGAGLVGLGVVADGLVVGVGSLGRRGAGVGEADADAEADAVGLASAVGLTVGLAVGSANALVAGAPTRAAATSRVPARRSRAPRAVVGVDIGAFLSGSRLLPEPPGAPVTRAPSRIPRRFVEPLAPVGHSDLPRPDVATHGCGTVPDLDRLPPNRCVWVSPEGDGQTLLLPRGWAAPRSERGQVGVAECAGPVGRVGAATVRGVDHEGAGRGRRSVRCRRPWSSRQT